MAQLKYDITPANATRFAADIAGAVEKNEGVKLDYSVASLAEVDKDHRPISRRGLQGRGA
jgi:hypothetical protein